MKSTTVLHFLKFLAHQNGSKNDLFHLHGRSFLAPFFGHRFAWAFWSSFGSPLAPFGSPLAPFWRPLAPFWLPFGPLWLPFCYLWLHFGTLWLLFRTLGLDFRVFWINFLNFQVSSHLSPRFLLEFRKINWKRNDFSVCFGHFFTSNFEENPHTTESTPIENKFPFAPWPSVDPEREFAAGNLDGTKSR